MAQLILTQAELLAPLWSDLDDDALGKVVKASMFSFKTIAEQQGKLIQMSAGIILCSMAVEANADKLKQTIQGLTIKGKPFGNWQITINKLPDIKESHE